jgi:hypothetical protein
MSSATPGEPLAPFSQKLTPFNVLDGWDIDVSCTPNRRVRTDKLLALVEQTYFIYSPIRRALHKEIQRPSPSFETFALLLIKLHNDYDHLLNVKETEMFLRDLQGIDPEIDVLDCKFERALGYFDFKRDLETHVDRVERLGYQCPHDPELKFWLYRISSYYIKYSVPGISDHFSRNMIHLREEFLESAHEFHNFQTSLAEVALTGHWSLSSPVNHRGGTRPSSFNMHDIRKHEKEKEFKVKRLKDVCNSFVVELAAIAEAANVPNYATLQRAVTD